MFDSSIYRNDIKLIKGDFQPKLNFNINPKETKNIFNNNFINTFNNFNNSNDNLKENINSNTLNLNNITNINNNFMNNEYMRSNNLINFPHFPHIFNNFEETVNQAENNSININNNNNNSNVIINKSPDIKEIEEQNKTEINDINKRNYDISKEIPMNINSKNSVLNSFNCGINKNFYPDINKLSFFPSLNNNLLIYPNFVNNTFSNTLFNYPLLNLTKSDNSFSVNKFGFNLEDNSCHFIGKKRP